MVESGVGMNNSIKGRAPSANSVRIMASRAGQLAVKVLIDTIQDKASNQSDRVNAALAILKIGVMPVHKAPYRRQSIDGEDLQQ